MRLVIVSNEAPAASGVYVGQRRPESAAAQNGPGSQHVDDNAPAVLERAWEAEFEAAMKPHRSMFMPFASQVITRLKGPVCRLLHDVYLNGLTDAKRIVDKMPAVPERAWEAEFEAAMKPHRSMFMPFASEVITRLKEPISRLLRDAYMNGLADGKRSGRINGGAPSDIILAKPDDPNGHPFEAHCITIEARQGPVVTTLPYDARLLQGAFSRQEQLDALLCADGKNTKIHVMSRSTAERFFQRDIVKSCGTGPDQAAAFRS